MKMKKIIAIILAAAGILSTGAAETRADPLLVKQGFFRTFFFFRRWHASRAIRITLLSSIGSGGGSLTGRRGCSPRVSLRRRSGLLFWGGTPSSRSAESLVTASRFLAAHPVKAF